MIRRVLYVITSTKVDYRLPNKIWLILGFSLMLLAWQSSHDVLAATPCLLCHPAIAPNTEIQVTEWNNSAHAHSLETLKAIPDAEDACLKCHTADYVFDPNITLDKAESNNDCAVCHADHKGIEKVFSGIGKNLLKPKNEVCNDCHSAGGATPGEKPRSAQVEIFSGTGGAGVSDSPGVHYTLMKDSDGCATCHLFKEKEDEVSEVGGHTFKANTAACLKCHTDPEKKKADAQKQISDQLAELKPLLETFADKESEDFKNAEYDINLVEISGDLGVHNLTYSKKLLDYSASVLKGGEKPKAEEPCLLCHKALSVAQVTGWEQSKHANSLDTLKASPDAEDACLQCHSVDYRLDPANVTLETAELPNGCGSCHADHKGIEKVFSGIGKNLLKPKNEVCNDCHTVGDAKPGDTLQAAQVEIFTGTGGIGVPDSPSIHFSIHEPKDGCVYCHTPSMTSETGEEISHTFEANLAVCSTCHKEPTATLTQAQEQISTQLAELTKLLDEYTDKESETFKNAKFNVDLVSLGESGAHNLKYSISLLEYSKSLLEAPVVEFPAYDVNKDGVVDIADIDIVSAHFGESMVHEGVVADSPTHNPDVDGSGTVDISDLALIGKHFGEITAPAAAPAIAEKDGADK